MAKGLWIIIGIVVVVLIIGGIYFLSGSKSYSATTGTNTNPSSGTPLVSNPGTPTTYKINIQNFAFSPASLTIRVGDIVVWTNEQNTDHTVTSDSGSELSSGTLSTGQTYSHTFNAAGNYDYHCSIHTMMKGKIIVQ